MKKKDLLRNCWYFLSVFFCMHSILILNSEKYGVSYQLVDEDEKIYFAECFCPLRFLSNRSRISLAQLNYDLYNHFERESARFSERDASKKTMTDVLNLIRSKRYFIYRKKICLVIEDQSQLGVYSNEKLYSYNKDTYDFFELEKADSRVWQYAVLNQEWPYFNCSKKGNRFLCLNSCMKKKAKKFGYYYEANENLLIDLDHDNRQAIDEAKCLKECKKESESCKIVNFVPLGELNQKSTSVVFKSYALLTELEYWFEFLILILLFLNASIFQLLFKSIKILILRKNLAKRRQLCSKWAIFIGNLIFITVFYVCMIKNYLSKRDYPITKEMLINSNSIKLEPINLVVCLQINKILDWDFRFDEKNYGNITYAQLEKLTDEKFNKSRISIYLDFQGKRMEVEWEISSNVFFKFQSRCYQIRITIHSAKLQKFSALFKLVIEYQYRYPLFYLLHDKENFNTQSFRLEKTYAFYKMIKKRSKVNEKLKCLDYRDLGCSSRYECIDKCINEKFFSKNSYIYSSTVLDKNKFSKQTWSSLIFKTKNSISDIEYKKAEKECSKKLSQLDCTEFFFVEETVASTHVFFNKLQIDLNYEIASVLEQEPSILSLLFNMLNIEVIVFGLNFKKLLDNIGRLFRLSRFRFGHRKHLILLMCSFGFAYHTFFIIKEIVVGDLTYNQFYMKLNRFHLPDLIFCFHNPIADSNLSTNYEALKLQRINEVFDKILYLNQSNDWSMLRKRGNYSNMKDIEFEWFHLLDRECFILKINVIYEPDQFYFKENSNVLNIYFNKFQLYRNNEPVSFMSKNKHFMLFSKILELTFRDAFKYRASCLVRQEIYDIVYKDQFSYIKKQISFFYKDKWNSADRYLRILTNDFERNHPVKQTPKPKSNQTHSEMLFDEFIKQIQAKTETRQMKSNRKQLTVNYLAKMKPKSMETGDFIFRPIFFKRIIEIRNGTSYSKLILNLLSTISFWFDLGLLDFYLNVFKLQFLYRSFRRLICF